MGRRVQISSRNGCKRNTELGQEEAVPERTDGIAKCVHRIFKLLPPHYYPLSCFVAESAATLALPLPIEPVDTTCQMVLLLRALTA